MIGHGEHVFRMVATFTLAGRGQLHPAILPSGLAWVLLQAYDAIL
jgi:hypothetical protein